MEITLEAIISLVGLFVGGGGGAFFTWRWMNRKAKAEAITAEVDATKEMQDLYKRMLSDANEYLEDARNKVEGLRQERDHYKQDRDELRKQVEHLTRMFYELKTESEKERSKLRIDITNLQNQLKGIVSMTCIVPDCKLRKIMDMANFGQNIEDQNRKRRPTKRNDIEPNNEVI